MGVVGVGLFKFATRRVNGVGRGELYGDELGLQLVRVDAGQLLYVLGQEVPYVQVALVVSEELEEASGVI